MSKTLTITLTDIPDDMLTDLWRDAIATAKEDVDGFEMTETENIIINADRLFKRVPEALIQLLGSASTGHLIYQMDKANNYDRH